MNEWMRITVVIAVPLAVIAAVVLFEALRVLVSQRRRREIRRRVQEFGVATTMVELLKAHEREATMNRTTTGPEAVIHFDIIAPTLVRDAVTHTSAAGRQPLNTTKYVGAVPTFAKPDARTAE